MQMTVEEKPPAAENSDEMQIVEIDEGLVEMTDKNADGGDLQRGKGKKKSANGKKKKEDIEEITIDSDSEEEEVAVVGADNL